jgi:hypothetical protein
MLVERSRTKNGSERLRENAARAGIPMSSAVLARSGGARFSPSRLPLTLSAGTERYALRKECQAEAARVIQILGMLLWNIRDVAWECGCGFFESA